MIAITIGELAEAVGGRLDGGADPQTVISGRVTIDSRSIAAGDLFVAIPGERADGHDFAAGAVAAGAIAVLASRPVGVPAVLVDDPVIGLGRLARAVRGRLSRLTVIGVTGSSGKTSTKDLLAAVLARGGATVATQGSYNNELGLPLTVLRADTGTRFLIVEMGARGAGHIAYLCDIARPGIGVELNIGSAHAGVFGSRTATAAAKAELVAALPPNGLAVLNAGDPLVAGMAGLTRARVVFTGRGADAAGAPPVGPEIKAEIRAERIGLDDQARAHFDLVTPQGRVPVSLAVHGEHQVDNAVAAAAVGIEAGLSLEEVAAGLSGAVAASRWRMEVSRCGDGLTVVNDAYNANPQSMAAALRALAAMTASASSTSASSASPGEAPTGRWAVLGEMLELGPESAAEHRAIGRLIVELGLAGVIAVGSGAAPIADGAAQQAAAQPEPAGWPAGAGLRVLRAEGVDEALTLVQQNVPGTDIILIKASRSVGLERLANGILNSSQRRQTA